MYEVFGFTHLNMFIYGSKSSLLIAQNNCKCTPTATAYFEDILINIPVAMIILCTSILYVTQK